MEIEMQTLIDTQARQILEQNHEILELRRLLIRVKAWASGTGTLDSTWVTDVKTILDLAVKPEVQDE